MIHSIIPDSIIFGGKIPETEYIQINGILMETENGRVRRIISTNPSDYLSDITSIQESSE